MKGFSKMRLLASGLFGVVAMVFFLFFVYMGLTENVSVYSSRHAHDYHTITEYTVEQVSDALAPVGVRTVYHWILQDVDSSESCLCFYLSHHYARVYIDGELVHELAAAENNRIGGTVGSNWVTVPVHQEDDGKEIQIVLTPLFEDVVDFEPEILIGSHFTIVFDQLRQDIPQLFISLLCIFMGVIIIVAQLYFIVRIQNQSFDMVYLGVFSVVLGMWRMTDLRISPVLFESNPMVLGYVSVGCLFLCGVALLLYASTLYSEKKSVPLLVLSGLASVTVLGVLAVQLSGIADLREMLFVCHMILIVAVLSVPVVTILYRSTNRGQYVDREWAYYLILMSGVLVDIARFYVRQSTDHIMFTVVGFLLYAMIVFITNILETTNKANLDMPTGLLNRACWDELMLESEEETVALVMIDLNGLKKVNDTYGHASGDFMIRRFSGVLRATFPPECQICRWGGDEFTILTTGATVAGLETYLDMLRSSVDAHNRISGELPISYAVGVAYSAEYPQMSRLELLAKADEQMYQEKRNRRS